MGNDHGRPKDVVGEVRQAFTSTADTAFDVCFENQLVGRSKFPRHMLPPANAFKKNTIYLTTEVTQPDLPIYRCGRKPSP